MAGRGRGHEMTCLTISSLHVGYPEGSCIRKGKEKIEMSCSMLYISQLDHEGRFESDPSKTRTFPKDTPLALVAEVVLGDIRSRPELLNPSDGLRVGLWVCRAASRS